MAKFDLILHTFANGMLTIINKVDQVVNQKIQVLMLLENQAKLYLILLY